MQAHEHLEPWKTPESYGGFSPVGDFCILAQHRDSDILSESNWHCALAQLNAQAYDGGDTDFNSRPVVYHWRAAHWAVGWVEYLMVRADAPADILTQAGEMVCALADYPVLDESDFSEREMLAAEEAWKNLDIRGRIELIAGETYDGKPISIFAARRDYPPSDDCGTIQNRLIGV